MTFFIILLIVFLLVGICEQIYFFKREDRYVLRT